MTDAQRAKDFGWPPEAIEFLELYARTERALKQAGCVKKGKKFAEADWTPFANALGPEFLEHVRTSHQAEILITEPPRRRSTLGLEWAPVEPQPIRTVEELFVRSICQVRNNLAHGEKFDITGKGLDRDLALVSQSLWVLKQALERNIDLIAR
jgi:hypothetical protein